MNDIATVGIWPTGLVFVALGMSLVGCRPSTDERTAQRERIYIAGMAKAIRWSNARWGEPPDHWKLRLSIGDRSYWQALEEKPDESLWLLCCYLPYARRGEAARMLNSRGFEGNQDTVPAVASGDARSAPFRYTGGNFRVAGDDDQYGAFIAISQAPELAPVEIRNDQQVELSLDPAQFRTPAKPIRLANKGRIAFKLQRRNPEGAVSISTTIELSVNFSSARNTASSRLASAH